jgi:hypothetical protein
MQIRDVDLCLVALLSLLTLMLISGSEVITPHSIIAHCHPERAGTEDQSGDGGDRAHQ